MKLALLAALAATVSAQNSCTVSYASQTGLLCPAATDCSFKCSQQYDINIAGSTATLTVAATPQGCNCDTGSGLVSGSTISGQFDQNTNFVATNTGSSVSVGITYLGMNVCNLTYYISAGNCLGSGVQPKPMTNDASSSTVAMGAAAVAVGAGAAFAAAM